MFRVSGQSAFPIGRSHHCLVDVDNLAHEGHTKLLEAAENERNRRIQHRFSAMERQALGEPVKRLLLRWCARLVNALPYADANGPNWTACEIPAPDGTA